MVETIKLTADDGREVEFYVEEHARLNGENYLLVVDSQEGDAEALILKDISEESSEEAMYIPVEDEKEISAVLKIFEEMLDDTDIVM